jgi:carbonic anhydrase/acetyltransferase-like protein (isoleucine patch superfamily)
MSAPTTSTSQPPAPSLGNVKTPVTLGPTAFIGDNAHVRGPNPVTITARTLVHPRAYLYTHNSPISIGMNTIIYPKAVIGGPFIPTNSSEPDMPNPKLHILTTPQTADKDTSSIPLPGTIIGSNVSVHAHAHVQNNVTVGDSTIIESHATLLPGSRVGAHCKICAGVTLPGSARVPDWTVVYGNGSMRRMRPAGGTQQGNQILHPNDALTPPKTQTPDMKAPALDAIFSATAANPITETYRLITHTLEREAASLIMITNHRLAHGHMTNTSTSTSTSNNKDPNAGRGNNLNPNPNSTGGRSNRGAASA